MKRQSVIIFLIICLLITGGIFAQKKLSLQDAVTIALNRNINVIKTQNSLATYKANVKTAYGSFLPNLSAGGSWGWQKTDDDGSSQLDYLGEERTTASSQNESRSYSISAGGSITLFDGLSSFANLNQKKNNYEAAKLDLEKLKQDIIYQTASYYFSVISYDKLLKYQEENYKYNVSLLDKIREMKELKMIPVSDVYSQEVQTANSESALLQAQNNYEKAQITLLNYLSLDIADVYIFESEGFEKDFTNYSGESFEQLCAAAFANRKDYQSQKLKLESTNDQLTIANADYLPSLSGSYKFSTSALSLGDLFNRRVYSLGLSLNVPVFSGWSTDYAVESAEVQIKNTNEELLNLERSIKSEVKNVMLDLQTAKKQVEVTQKAILSAQESWKIKKESYELGKVTFIELQQSYSDLLQAQNNNVQAVYNYFTKNYELMNVLGVIE